jgi:predicted ATPase
MTHPFSVGFALVFAAWLHQLRREGPRIHEWAEAAIALVAEHKFVALLAQGTIMRGWAVAAQGGAPRGGQGQGEDGVSQIQQGLAAWRATGAEGVRPYYLALQAEASAQMGQPEAALTLLAEALAVANDTGERRWEAEVHRLKGEVLFAHAAEQHAEADICFRQALEIARRQQAKSLELRAAMSLSRLWQQQGKRAEAYALLAPIYGWFTEGFDTADLQEAKVLLETLAG